MKDVFKTMQPVKLCEENSRLNSNIESGLKIMMGPQSQRQENEVRGRKQVSSGSGSGGMTANFQSLEEMKIGTIEDLEIPKPS
jgi:hypothetical protein